MKKIRNLILIALLVALGLFYYNKNIETNTNVGEDVKDVELNLEPTSTPQPTEQPNENVTIEVSETDIEFFLTKGYPIEVYVTGTTETPTFSVSDDELIEVIPMDKTGWWINSVSKIGTGSVTVSIGDVSKTINVTVNKFEEKVVNVETNINNNNQGDVSSNYPKNGDIKVENGQKYVYDSDFKDWLVVLEGGGILGNVPNGGGGAGIFE